MSNPPSNSVVSVHTEDAAPDAPKYRLSAVVGHDTATVVIHADTGMKMLRPGLGVRPGAGVRPQDPTIEPGGILPGGDLTPGQEPYVGALRLTTGPTRKDGPVFSLGAVCGIARCGGPGVMPLRNIARRGAVCGDSRCGATKAYLQRRDRPFNPTITIKRSQLTAPDGDVSVTVWTLAEPEGWV